MKTKFLKAISGFLATVLFSMLILTVPALAAVDFPFTDVPVDAWYRLDVEAACKNGLINGKTATIFAPNDEMTLAEAVKIAACMHQLYHEGTVTLENTSAPGAWYIAYMDYAWDVGIILSEHAYDRANDPITRYEFVDTFYKALPESEYPAINDIADGWIPDVDIGQTFIYISRVYAFYRAGILTGDETGAFNGDSTIKRSEVSAIITRMLNVGARKTIL